MPPISAAPTTASLLPRCLQAAWRLQGQQAATKDLREAHAALVAAQERYDTERRRLTARHPKAALATNTETQLGMEDVLPFAKQQNAACLEYSVGATESHVWLIDPQAGTIVHRTLDVGRATLEEQVSHLVRTIRSGESAVPLVQAQLRKLADLLLPPETASLVEGSRLVIIPDGPLHGLPFGLLQVADKPLLQRHVLTYAPSLAVWRALAAKRRGTDLTKARILCLGRPQLPPGRWADLPFAEAEVRAIGTLAGTSATVLIGADATESHAKSSAADFDILHFATHGSLAPERPAFSSLVLSPDATPGGQDGLLRATEIVDLDLKARLVVLSACQSGIGGYVRGEGLMGLSRAFFAAGAEAVLATQWEIGDASTADFAAQFYAQLLKGQSPAEALRTVQTDWARRKGLASAAQWAPFIVVGIGE